MMGVPVLLPVLLLLLAMAGVGGQTDAGSPYRGEEARQIKALSPGEVAALLAGEGMGLAKAAELNGYPGPAHVLMLADELKLDAEQLAATRAIEREMRAAAIAAGRKLVETERELDRLFASRTVTPESLRSSLDTIAALRAELRRVHLEAHLRQTELLNPAQIKEYALLRGYHGGNHDEQSHPQ